MARPIIAWLLAALLAGSVAPADQRVGPQAKPPARPEDTPELIIFMRPGQDPQRVAQRHGLQLKQRLRSSADVVVLSADSPVTARIRRQQLAGEAAVEQVFINQRTSYVPMAFVPNDPYFPKDTPAPGFPGQWHLINTVTLGLDAGVQGAWLRDVTGAGVILGVVDDGLETTHPDLQPNYVAASSWDFGQNDPDPDPVNSTEKHGIAVAGVAGARGGNGIGVTGVAPHVGLAGLRIDYTSQTTQMFVDATLYQSSGADTAIKVKNHSYGLTQDYIATPADLVALALSTAAGTIHCFAGGNSSNDANKQDLAKSPDAITVAALGADGIAALYSGYGACVSVAAPSSSYGLSSVTTTDRSGTLGYNQDGGDLFPDAGYTSIFGGTSSATPVVAGVMALGKQVQPALNTRFAKHLLARSCTKVEPGHALWTINAAGLHFNPRYGFGLINADAFTLLAPQFPGVTALTTEESALMTINEPIPDGDETGVTRSFEFTSMTPLEEVLVYLKIAHPFRGHVSAYLISPDGLRSRLLDHNSAGYGTNIDWTFTTNQFWGENPAGTWTVQVRDAYAGNGGTWEQCRISARMGRLIGQCPLGPAVTAVTPTTADNLNVLTGVVIQGTNLESGQVVKLTTSAGYDILAANVQHAPDGQSLTCEFDLTGAPPGAYNVVVTQAGCVNARLPNAFSVTGSTTVPAPTITVQPVSARLCSGVVTFSLAASGPGPLSYQWQRDGADLSDGGHYSGVHGATLTINPATSSDLGDYRCIVSNAGGSTGSDEASLAALVAADFDGDCDVDVLDFSVMLSCAQGPMVTVGTACRRIDLDGDADVDMDDFGLLQRCYSGDGQRAEPACAD